MTTPDGELGLVVALGVGVGEGLLGLALAVPVPDCEVEGEDVVGAVVDALEEQALSVITTASDAPRTTVPAVRGRALAGARAAGGRAVAIVSGGAMCLACQVG